MLSPQVTHPCYPMLTAGPAIYQTAGAKSLYVRVDTELQPDNGASDVGLGDIELDTPYHWEIMMNSQGVLTIKQNGTNIKCTDLGSAKAISPNEPLFFGSDTAGSFTLSNLKVYSSLTLSLNPPSHLLSWPCLWCHLPAPISCLKADEGDRFLPYLWCPNPNPHPLCRCTRPRASSSS